jgi:hypothetical protein
MKMAHCSCIYQCLILNILFLVFVTREDVAHMFNYVQGQLKLDIFPLESGFVETNLWWNQWISSPSALTSTTAPAEFTGIGS